MIYPIVAYGDPILKKKAANIPQGTDIKKLAEDMFETMYHANGVGLAAPQIGKSLRLFVIDAEPMDEEKLKDCKKVFVNAQIIEEQGEKWSYEEGCLSIPKIRESVSRCSTIQIRYFDENWKEHTETFDGLLARVIQHEYDHIEGILFTDHLSAIKKRLLQNKLNNISKGKVDAEYKMRFYSK